MMNPTDDTQVFYPGTYVATASQVHEVQKIKQYTKVTGMSVCVPPHLQDLYNRTFVGLDPKQRKDVAVLLNRYFDIF